MPNHLASVQSLYLRKHANNPIDWWYWCDEALEEAKRENKPIFLSIGYSSCHWCTVMEGEAFCNQEIAAYMNANFLPIKVDREERPDIDSIYMQALQMMVGQGGWPLNIFLTPDDLVPFYGGTYFPVEPRFGRPGFLQVLQSVRRYYDVEKEKLSVFKREILSALQQSTIIPKTETRELTEEILNKGIETNTGVIGADNFGHPCFPMIPYAELALRGSRFNFTSRYNIKKLSTQRGKDLALGGIFDHVAGGFHRYTVDSTWTVPHFEKMLYDNGQIVEYLANLYSKGEKEPAFVRAITLTVKWLYREMTAPAGYFYAASDADSFTSSEDTEPEEGAFYVWDYTHLEHLLTGGELEELKAEFSVSQEGNFEESNVLQRLKGGKLSDNLELILDKLFTIRYGASSREIEIFPPVKNNQEAKLFPQRSCGRIPPVTDTKMIVAWNSLMISGLARAYSVLGERSYWLQATNAAKFIINNQWVGGRFYRLNYDGKPEVLAQAEDYALFIKALLDLQAASPQESQWLEKALEVQQEFNEYFFSVEEGSYYNNAKDDTLDLLVRERSYVDNATPAANGVACANLIRLALLTDNMEYFDKAEQILQAMSAVMLQSPQACPSLFSALDWYLHGTVVKSNLQQLQMLIPQYFPTCVYRLESDLPPDSVAIVCKGFSCLEPLATEEDLYKILPS